MTWASPPVSLAKAPRRGRYQPGRIHLRQGARLTRLGDDLSGARARLVLDHLDRCDNPRMLPDGPVPRLLDDWQTSPVLWNHVRREVDERHAAGQFLLTGSATPVDDTTNHSGAGRLARVHMRPMTLVELGRNAASLSLARLLWRRWWGLPRPGIDLRRACRRGRAGGWPALRQPGSLTPRVRGAVPNSTETLPVQLQMRSDVRRGISLLARAR